MPMLFAPSEAKVMHEALIVLFTLQFHRQCAWRVNSATGFPKTAAGEQGTF